MSDYVDRTLAEFGADTTPDPPTFQQRGVIRFVHPKRGLQKSGLLVAVTNRGEDGDHPLAYYKPVTPSQHYHNVLEGYCISDSALRDCEKKGVSLVFFGESDTDDVHEFALRDYAERAGDVPSHLRQWEADTQKVRTLDDARHTYHSHREDLFRPAGDDGEFSRGTDR